MYAQSAMEGYGMPAVGAQNELTEICYGLRSPNFATRVQAVKDFAALLPAVLVEENAFIKELGKYDCEDLDLYNHLFRDHEELVQAVKDTVAYLTLAVSDVFVTRDVVRMAQIAYFFNLVGQVVQNGESAQNRYEEVRDELMASLDEVDDLKSALRNEQENRRCVETQMAEERRKMAAQLTLSEQINSVCVREMNEENVKLAKEVEALRKEVDTNRDHFQRVLAEKVAVLDDFFKQLQGLESRLADQEKAAESESAMQMKIIDELRKKLECSQKTFDELDDECNQAYKNWERNEKLVCELAATNDDLECRRSEMELQAKNAENRNAELESEVSVLKAELEKALKASENLIERPKDVQEALKLLNPFVHAQKH